MLLVNLGVAMDADVCEGPNPCIYKCCPSGEGLINDQCVQSDVAPVVSFTSRYSSFTLLSSPPSCSYGSYELQPILLFPNGSLDEDGVVIPQEEFCVDVDLATEDPEDLAIVCALDSNSTHVPTLLTGQLRFKIYPVFMTLSILGLLGTLVTYSVIPELRNCHGLCVISHITILTVGYVFLSSNNILGANQSKQFCGASGTPTLILLYGCKGSKSKCQTFKAFQNKNHTR